ncbi:MAG TPA: flagellar M-ring protein FliF C-terminal domain-containing protein, partial [bacterium]
DNVTILDSNGNLLSGLKTSDASIGLSSTQMELQNKVENYLAAKAQSMLDGVLGAGRSIVRVSSELDFQKLERTSEIYDPESAVVRSEELMESTTNEVDSSPSKEANSLTNYEINKTVEHLVNNGGSIKRLSAAVIVDGVYKAGADGSAAGGQYTARSAKEMAALGNMVRGALGFHPERGDVLEITNIAFNKEAFEEQASSWAAAEKKDFIIALLPKAILGLVLIMLALMIRKFLRHNLKLTQSVLELPPAVMTAGGPAAQLLPGTGAAAPRLSANVAFRSPEEEMSEEAREAAMQKKQITEFARSQPEAATMLLKSWLLEK